MMKKIKSPVIFDANILMNFKGQLKFIFGFFENILIHKKVLEEVLGESIKEEIDSIKEEENIIIVTDKTLNNELERILFQKCDKELKDTFNIKDSKDLGEYKTLLYAKFNGIKLLSSQDTTVWRFMRESIFFNDIECISMQDIAFLIYLNAINKNDRKMAKSLYNHFGRGEHPFQCFISYMEKHENDIPKYIEFENNRIENFDELVNGYIEFYSKDLFYDKKEIEGDIVNAARSNPETCTSCLYSRINQKNVDYDIRVCIFNYKILDEDCIVIREEFSKFIKNRR